MKKILCVISILLFLFISLNINAKALDISKEEVIVSASDVVTTSINGMATLSQSNIKTYNNGVKEANKLDTHSTSWVSLNGNFNTMDARVVSYSGGLPQSWQGKRPTDLAKLFEKEHPGWIVLAGINGDFFYINDNCEPVGTFMQEGDLYKSWDYNDGTGHVGVGFKDDGSYVYGYATTTSKEKVQLLQDDGTYLDIADIDVINNTPTTTGVSLLTRYNLMSDTSKTVVVSGNFSYDLTGYKIYKIKYELERLDRQTGLVFLKGEVSEIVNNITTLSLDDKELTSYLVTKGNELDTLKVGDNIRCQKNLTGDWEGVNNIIGAWAHIMQNNVIYPNGAKSDYSGNEVPFETAPNDYVNPIKNRTVIGFKEDGSLVLLNVEKNSYGASYTECASILRAIGCCDGFLFDGGGSSCIFVRDEAGSFNILNSQEDGHERSDANALLLVTRDPGFSIDITPSRSSATVSLDIDNETYFNNLSNIKVSIGNQELAYTGSDLTFNNLDEDTSYTVKVSYELDAYSGTGKRSASITKSFDTLPFTYPESGLSITQINKNSITVSKDTTLSTSSWITNVTVHIGPSTYYMGEKNNIVCEDLIEETDYQLWFTYTIVDPDTSNKYEVSTIEDPIAFTTLSYNLPTFEKMEISSVNEDQMVVAYKYVDNDKIVQKASLYVNGVLFKELTVKNSTVKITLVSGNNKVKIILECTTKEGKDILVESEELEYNYQVDNPNPPIEF